MTTEKPASIEGDEALPRVLVLGSEGHGRNVRAFFWMSVPETLNVADYDVVILNFGRVSTSSEHLPSAEQFARLLFSENSAVIAFGDPMQSFVRMEPMYGRMEPVERYRPVTWWLPVELPAKLEGGEAIRNVDSEWTFWFDNVRKYSWHFVDDPKPSDPWAAKAAAQGVKGAEFFVAEWTPLAETRFGEPIGVSLTLYAVGSHEGDPKVIAESSPIVWLHALTELDDKKAVDLLLSRFAGIAVEQPAPDWLRAFRLPKEVSAEEAVVKSQEAVADADAQLRGAREDAARESRFGKLLYEQGKDVLEPVVREALEMLGATVTPPGREGIEDGRLVDPSGRPAMLEIKGRKGQLGLEDVRQLHGWFWTAVENEQWEGKCIVVANLKLSERPDLRDDLIAPNAAKFASDHKIAILLTTQLHEALRQHHAGSFDSAAFWDAVFAAAGLVDLSNPKAA
jgi:hypothetical protein